MNDTDDEIDGFLAKYERMVSALHKLTHEELGTLLEWEKNNVTGDSKLRTSDWPGWSSVYKRLSH